VSGDFGFLHMDAPRAAQGHFGGRVAHGSLLISIALGLGSIDVPQSQTVAMVGTNWRFLRPVKPGMTVHATWRLGRKREVTDPRWGLASWQVEMLDQGGEAVLEGEVTLLVARREAAGPPAAKSRRRRRGQATTATAAPPLPTAEANLPEPAPADSSPPARRRRRSGGSSSRAEAPAAAAEPVAAAEATPPEPAPAASASPARRRRRRRGGGGGAASAASGNVTAATPTMRPEPAPEPPLADPPRSSWATPEPASPAPAPPESSNPVRRALGRLRRPRSNPPATPAEPAP
jgi:acyl dehydratase